MASQDLGLWIDRLTTEELLALAVRIRWLLSSSSCHLEEGTRGRADITFGHRAGPHSPGPHGPPWRVALCGHRLMAHMGAYSLDEMNRLHWRWHQRAALRIRTAMQGHNIRAITGSPGYQGPASGHRRPRSHKVLEPPRQAARRNSPGRHQGPPMGWVPPLAHTEAPSDRSPRGGTKAALTPQGCRAARRSRTRRQGTLAAPGAAAARRLPQHGESSSTKIWREAMEGQTTSTPNRHHLPPIPFTGPRGPARNGRTSPPFQRQPSENDGQRFTHTPTMQQTVRPACPPPPSKV